MRTHWTKLFISFAVSVVVTYTLASFAHTQQVLSGLLQLGVLIPVADRIAMIAGDWVGLYLYLAVIAIGLLIAFGVMALLRRVLPVHGSLIYAVGGALAMLVILWSMRELGSLTPIAGARGALGMSLQADGAFHLLDTRGYTLFSLCNVDTTPFQHHTFNHMRVKGLTLLLDVPRVEKPAYRFDELVVLARRLAQELGATVVDDHRVLLSDAGLAQIREQIVAIESRMLAGDIQPGSARAHRLFE